jgi:hypothetical protein
VVLSPACRLAGLSPDRGGDHLGADRPVGGPTFLAVRPPGHRPTPGDRRRLRLTLPKSLACARTACRLQPGWSCSKGQAPIRRRACHPPTSNLHGRPTHDEKTTRCVGSRADGTACGPRAHAAVKALPIRVRPAEGRRLRRP